MNRTDRLYALVEELRAVAPRPRSARRLAERFEVSTRTIERVLSALQQAGVPIWAEPGRTGGYCIDPSHTLPPLGLTVDESLAVTIGLGMLATSPFQAAASSGLQKILAITDDRRLQEAIGLAERVHLLGGDEPPPALPVGFADALRGSSVLRLRYRDRDGDETLRDVEPLGCIGRDGHWYLIAWCRLREGVRAFRGDRILAAEATGERPPRRSYGPEEFDIPYGDLRPVYAAP
jgi:predicted DNA-binding transcriptional regulator YafY